MICSSVNFDRFMVRSSRWAGLYHQMEGKPGVTAISPERCTAIECPP